MPKLLQAKDNLDRLLNLKINKDSADLYIYGDIVSSWWGAWDNTDQYPDKIKTFLDNAKGKDLNVHVNSGGGSVFAGIAIYNQIKNFEGTKTAYIDGAACSIASVIPFGCDRVVMRTGSTLMVHKPLYCIMGAYNANDFRKMASDLDSIQECIMQVYKQNMALGSSESAIKQLVENETYMSSDEAIKYFKVEQEETGLHAVACESEFLNQFFEVPSYLQNDKLLQAKMEFELLQLKGGH